MDKSKKKEKGTRRNEGKPWIGEISGRFLEGLGQVLTLKKEQIERGIERGNWKKGFPEEEIIDSLMRHYVEYIKGNKFDDDTGHDHRFHMAVNLMFWIELYFNNKNWE